MSNWKMITWRSATSHGVTQLSLYDIRMKKSVNYYDNCFSLYTSAEYDRSISSGHDSKVRFSSYQNLGVMIDDTVEKQ